jgi:hypothetical protein
MTRLQAGPSGVRIPSGVRNLSFLPKVQTCSVAHTLSYTMVNEAFALGIKQKGRDADHSPTSSAEVRNQRPLLPPFPLYVFMLVVGKLNLLYYLLFCAVKPIVSK